VDAWKGLIGRNRKMARKNPSDTRSLREKIDKGIHTAPGEAIGGLIEKIKLGGREATGTHKFSETYQGRRKKKMAGIKGLAARTDIY
jgi:hypothetical protein